jgi:hypothetical protein
MSSSVSRGVAAGNGGRPASNSYRTAPRAANCVDVESVSALTQTTIWAGTQDYASGPAHVARTHSTL